MKEEERKRGEDELEKDRGALAGSRRSQGSLSGGLVGLARKARANCCCRRRITCWVSVVSAAFVIAASVFSLSLSSCAERAGWAECQMSHFKLIFRSLFFFFFLRLKQCLLTQLITLKHCKDFKKIIFLAHRLQPPAHCLVLASW